MSGINRATIVGNVGRDPEIKYAASGTCVANLSVATSEVRTDRGTKVEETEWHRVVLFGKAAEIAEQYVKKGSMVGIEGRIKTEKWTDKDGVERYTTKIMGDRLYLLGGRGGGDAAREDDRPARRAPQQQSNQSFEDMDDDIPF